MGGVVPDQRQRARIVAGDDLNATVAGDGVGKVSDHPVERHGDRLLGERLRDALGDRAARYAGVEIANRIVGKSQAHGQVLSCSLPRTDAGKRWRLELAQDTPAVKRAAATLLLLRHLSAELAARIG